MRVRRSVGFATLVAAGTGLAAGPAWADANAAAEVNAALEKLERLQSRRQVIRFQMLDAAEDIGLGSAVTAFVAPDRSHTSLEINSPELRLQVQSIVIGSRTAVRIDSPELERSRDEGRRMMAAMMGQGLLEMAQSVARAAVDPVGSALELASNAIGVGMMGYAMKKSSDSVPLGRWKCQDDPGPTGAESVAPIRTARAAGEGEVRGLPVRSYEILLDQGGERYPARLHVARDTGLPARLELRAEPGFATWIDFQDFDAPLSIELPSCS